MVARSSVYRNKRRAQVAAQTPAPAPSPPLLLLLVRLRPIQLSQLGVTPLADCVQIGTAGLVPEKPVGFRDRLFLPLALLPLPLNPSARGAFPANAGRQMPTGSVGLDRPGWGAAGRDGKTGHKGSESSAIAHPRTSVTGAFWSYWPKAARHGAAFVSRPSEMVAVAVDWPVGDLQARSGESGWYRGPRALSPAAEGGTRLIRSARASAPRACRCFGLKSDTRKWPRGSGRNRAAQQSVVVAAT